MINTCWFRLYALSSWNLFHHCSIEQDSTGQERETYFSCLSEAGISLHSQHESMNPKSWGRQAATHKGKNPGILVNIRNISSKENRLVGQLCGHPDRTPDITNSTEERWTVFMVCGHRPSRQGKCGREQLTLLGPGGKEGGACVTVELSPFFPFYPILTPKLIKWCYTHSGRVFPS